MTPRAMGSAATTPLLVAAQIVHYGQDPWYLLDAFWTLTNRKRRSLHDLIGRTVVIRVDR